MKQIIAFLRFYRLRVMAAVGTAGAAAVLLLRLVLTPTLRDPDTGRFAANLAAIITSLALLLLLAGMTLAANRERVDIGGKAALPASLATLLSGVVLLVSSLWEAVAWLAYDAVPAPAPAALTLLPVAMVALTLLCGVAAGGALMAFGLQITAEDGTRRGMRTVSCLLPVLWVWLRLARYEMSYVSAVSLKDSYFTFAMYIFELLFLFKLARFVSGIGDTRPATVLFFAMGAAMLTLTAPLFRIGMVLAGDAQAYHSTELAGSPDAALGLLALVFGWALAFGRAAPSEDATDSSETSQA